MTSSQQTAIQPDQHRFDEDAEFRRLLRRTELKRQVWEQYVEAFRREPDRSQKEVANASGKSREQICRALKGPQNMTLDTVADLFSGVDNDVFLATHIEPSKNCRAQASTLQPVSTGGHVFYQDVFSARSLQVSTTKWCWGE